MYLRTYDQLRVDRRNRVCFVNRIRFIGRTRRPTEIARSIFHCELVPISDSTLSFVYVSVSACVYMYTYVCVRNVSDDGIKDRETSIEGNIV